MRKFVWLVALAAMGLSSLGAMAQDGGGYVKKATWLESMIATRTAIAKSDTKPANMPSVTLLSAKDFSFMARVKTTQGGTVVALCKPDGPWIRYGRSLFIDDRGLGMDLGMVGWFGGGGNLKDGKWHHVALVQKAGKQTIYVDGKKAADGQLEAAPSPGGALLMLGYTSTDFPKPSYFTGEMDDVRIFSVGLDEKTVAEYAEGNSDAKTGLERVAWTFDQGTNEVSFKNEGCKIAKGHSGDGLSFDGKARVILETSPDVFDAKLWATLEKDFPADKEEIGIEQTDGVWDGWIPGQYKALAAAYAAAISSAELQKEATDLAVEAGDIDGLKKVREVYIKHKRQLALDELLAKYELPAMRKMVYHMGEAFGDKYDAKKYLSAIEKLGTDIAAGNMAEDEIDKAVKQLRYEALFENNPKVNFDKVVFIKRKSYRGNHYYTEFINGGHQGGGNICVLDLKSGEVREVVKGLPENGVFRRFDLSYDAKRIVFDWKAKWEVGYRIYECNVDGSGFRQLTFPPEREEKLHKMYAIAGYHHGTDDMDPVYLPNGDIVFISTRSQYGILCDQPDIFTSTTLYRMDKDGKNMRKLSNSSVSENTPTIMPDGRMLYTRWEYVDKGSSCVKCLWSMKPDGSGSAEVYGNDIATPPTMIFGRAIPGASNKFVMIGSPHCCPWVAIGTVIRLDMNKDIRTREPMEYMTPDVDVRGLGGESRLLYKKDGKWITNINGPIYRDPYPLCEQLFLVSHKPEGPAWNEPNGWALYMLDENGEEVEFYRDKDISCWEPIPLVAREKPPLLESRPNPTLAKMNKAMCIVTDVNHGMDGVERGKVKYIRILEQRPRPWAARRYWRGDSGWGQQHVVTTRSTHLGLKVQHGVVPVEEDGSASFLVPAKANIFFQALDENYRSLQTERTLVNYMPGEIRSCTGCHETPNNAARPKRRGAVLALKRPPSMPQPQPGDKDAGKIIDFRTMVQPVLDKYCIECHSPNSPKKKVEGGLDLSGTETDVFNIAYEQLLSRRLCGRINNEVAPKTGNAEYQPPYTFGSYSSILGAMLADGEIKLADEGANKRVAELIKSHKDVKMPLEAKIRIWNWVDTNCQFYGSYWGRRNKQHKDHPNYRPISTFEESRSNVCPIAEEKR